MEIDGVLTARRNGRDCLFIVEAKHGDLDSLSKTKLLYPYLALLSYVPNGMPVMLLYIRATTTESDIIYNIVECATPSPSHPSPLDMRPISVRRYSVTKPKSK